MGLSRWLSSKITNWLIHENQTNGAPLSDFKRICYEIRPCDVLLIEGRSRVSDVIKTITQSNWTHSVLYIGRLPDIEDPDLREFISQNYEGDQHDQLIIEALMGEGTVIYPLKKYQDDHVRLCRPKGLSHEDMLNVIAYSIRQVGTPYDVRQLLDIARFMFPYAIVPRRWRSSLFHHHAGNPTRTVCSSMIAAAFHSVHYPVLPVLQQTPEGELKLFKRNTRIFTPCDFDYSPYFDIIKYPYLGFDNLAAYRNLPWNEDGVICNDVNDCFLPPPAITPEPKKIEPKAEPEVIESTPEAEQESNQTDENKPEHLSRLIPTINLLSSLVKDSTRA